MEDQKYVIEKNVPFRRKGVEVKQKYPFKDMEVGDSFYSESETGKTPEKHRSYIFNRVNAFMRTHHDKEWIFKTAAEGNGIRTWRIK